MSEEPDRPLASQVRRPYRTVFRSIFIASISLLPQIADAADIDHIPAVAVVLGVTAAVTRVLALPRVEAWLEQFVPWLAADPYEGHHRKDHE